MIKDEDDQARVATGGDKGNRLRSRLICNNDIGRWEGIR